MDELIKTFQTPALFYDEQCSLCRRFKQSLERLELKDDVNFYPIQDKRIYSFFSHIENFTPEALAQEVHFMTRDQKVLKGSEAISYLVQQNPKVNKFSWLVESKMGQKALDIFYNTSNRYRETLRKRCGQCNHK